MTGYPVPPPPGRRALKHTLRLWLLRLAGLPHAFALRRPARAPSSILLIRPDHIGDMLFLTPGLHALRAALPRARITLLAGPWGLSAVEGNRDVDEILTCAFPAFERRKRPWEGRLTRAVAPYRLLLETARDLRTHRFDAAVVLRFDHWWGAWLSALAGIPRRIGYDVPEVRPFLTEALPYESCRHEVEQNVSLLARLAPSADWGPGLLRFDVDPVAREWAHGWLLAQGWDPARPLVCIHPGAGAAVKLWSAASWGQVARELVAATGAQLVLTGNAGEAELARQVVRAAEVPAIRALGLPAIYAMGATTLQQLAALQEKCALVLGPDSGPLHLAVALGRPTVHLYGPVAPQKFGPWGDPQRHVVITPGWPCAPCDRLDWPPSELAQHGCMNAITPAQVVAAARHLLEG